MRKGRAWSDREAGMSRARWMVSMKLEGGGPGIGEASAFFWDQESEHRSGQVSRGSAGEYQADKRAGVARLSWRGSGR